MVKLDSTRIAKSKSIHKLITGLGTSLAMYSAALGMPRSVHAQVWSCAIDGVPTIKCVEEVFARALSTTLYLIGFAAFIAMIVGAYNVLLSGGDPKKVEVGQKTITYAIGSMVGIFIVWFILRFIASTTGVGERLLNFSIIFP